MPHDSELDDVEIREPPIKELTRARRHRRRWLRRLGCSPGCFIIVLLFFGVLTLLFFVTTGPQNVRAIPPEFPNTIPIYKPQSIQDIVHLSAQRKNRGLEFAAFVPKLILYPIARGLDYQAHKKFNKFTPRINLRTDLVTAKNFLEFIKTPVGPQTSTTGIVWKKLTADSPFLIDFYRGELERAGYAVDSIQVSPDFSFFSFRSTGARGWVLVQPATVEEYATEEMIVIVEYETK